MAGPASTITAVDFFGKDDPEAGVDKFKTVAFRALHEQRLDDELQQTRVENDRLARENAALSTQLRALQISFDTNVDDRERVLAFKSKRIEELHRKLKESDAINASLLQTINGNVATNPTTADSRAAMTALLQSNKPLFHALDACREAEYKHQLKDAQAQCAALTTELEANATLATDMRAFERDRALVNAQIIALESQLVALQLAKDDAVHFLERKLVFEHDRLRREKESDVRACEVALATQMRLQVDATTQQTIDENARVTLELRYQSQQVEALVKQLDAATTELTRVRQDASITEALVATLSQRNAFYEKLFAKLQTQDQLKNQRESRQRSERDSGGDSSVNSRRIHSPRKPPLPALGLGRLDGRSSNNNDSSSSSRDYADDDTGDRNDDDDAMFGASSHANELNSATQALDVHLQQRAFAHKQVDAMLQLQIQQRQRQFAQLQQSQQPLTAPSATGDRFSHRSVSIGPAPFVKKKIVLSKATLAPPKSFQRSGRKLLDAPTTLGAFVRQHAAISPRQHIVQALRSPPRDDTLRGSYNNNNNNNVGDNIHTSLLPELTVPPANAQDRSSDMWRPQAPPSKAPATARF